MPRPGPRRDLIAFRASPELIAELDRLAAELHRTRSDAIRELLEASLRERQS